MTRKQYNNVIQWTLLNCSSAEEDSLSVCRAVLKNLGMPFPNGSYRDVLRVLMSNEYMGWHSCTLEQAAECAAQGIPAVGISTSRVLVLSPDGEEEAVIKEAVNQEARKAFIPSSEELSLDERMEMQFFAYAEIGNGVMRLAGRTSGGYYSSPRYVRTSAKIRETPDGAEKTKLIVDCVLLVENENPVYKNGHDWIKVTYVQPEIEKNPNFYANSGWIPAEYTVPMPADPPGKNQIYNEQNKDLKDNQRAMLTNARYIYDNFHMVLDITNRWTSNAIYALLGNMIQESTMNPDFWTGSIGDSEATYGIVQWHPASKYFSWLLQVKKADTEDMRKDIDNQLEYLQYTVHNTDQWTSLSAFDRMSFYSFTKSYDTIQRLTECFMRCYEKPGEDEYKLNYRINAANMFKRWIEEF